MHRLRHNSAVLKKIGSYFAQFTALPSDKIDVGKKLLARHLVDHIRQAVALGIEVRRVYLLHIPRKHHLGILSGSGYDGLDFVGSKVLRFVYNQQRIR